MSYKISNRSVKILFIAIVLLLASNVAPTYASQEHYTAGVYAQSSNALFSIALADGLLALYYQNLGYTDNSAYYRYYAYAYSYQAYDRAYWSYYYAYYGYQANGSSNIYSYYGRAYAYNDYVYKNATQVYMGYVYQGYDYVTSAIDNAQLADYYNGLSSQYNNLASKYGLY